VEAAALCQLLEALPTLEAEIVDPAFWPTAASGNDGPTNQTRATSIATMRA
jgi:hypothetical protein